MKAGSVVAVSAMDDGRIKFDLKGAGEIVFDPAKASAANRKHAEFHGWKQRLSDAAALSRDTTNGQAASVADKFAAIKDLAEWYMEGGEEWARTGGGEGGKSITLEAIAKVKAIPYEQAEAEVTAFAAKKYAGDTKKALAFLRQGQRVMEAMDAIRKERTPAAKLDADAALAELV